MSSRFSVSVVVYRPAFRMIFVLSEQSGAVELEITMPALAFQKSAIKIGDKHKGEGKPYCQGNWKGLKPVTRMQSNPKAYNSQKVRKRNDDSSPCFLRFMRRVNPTLVQI